MRRIALDLATLVALYAMLTLGLHAVRSYRHFGWLNLPGPNNTMFAVPVWIK